MEKSVKELDTEQRIFNAAQMLFLQKGLSDTTMQDIANEAGISRTALHYYFRSKENLFEHSFNNVLENILPKVNQTINKDISLIDKLIEITDNYIETLKGNELLPGFMVMEMRRNPQTIINFVLKKWTTIDFSAINRQMEDEVSIGKIRRFDVSQMVVTLIGLCAFPFICKPTLDTVFNAIGSEITFDTFVAERKKIIAEMLTNWLVIKR